jgi:hypothetical protein
MELEAITRYIKDTFDGLDVVEAAGDVYFFPDPDGTSDPAHRLPFATIVTSDAYDQFSNLDRPSVFRLNMGLSRDTFRSLFPSDSHSIAEDQIDRPDFTALDQLMPHPVYGNMFWLCVLSPSDSTFAKVRPLLAEAYAVALTRHQRSRRQSGQADATSS